MHQPVSCGSERNEDRRLKILESCRRANPQAKVLIVEMLLPPGGTPHPGKLLDLVMLVCADGQERTENEYADLVANAGYRLAQVVPTELPVSVVEAVRA